MRRASYPVASVEFVGLSLRLFTLSFMDLIYAFCGSSSVMRTMRPQHRPYLLPIGIHDFSSGR